MFKVIFAFFRNILQMESRNICLEIKPYLPVYTNSTHGRLQERIPHL